MADHHPGAPGSPPTEGDGPSARGTRYGQILFVFYLLLYGGYVFVTAFAPEVMERTPWAGVNLSVLYGMTLIGTAIVLAMLYDWLCRPGRDGALGGRRDGQR
jgi:uncharacterized membrane protein (DUF485 family)